MINQVPEHMREGAKEISPTVEASLIKIDYFLKVCVKHDAWNSWGDGKTIDIPITIEQAPLVMAMAPVFPMDGAWAPSVQPAVVFQESQSLPPQQP